MHWVCPLPQSAAQSDLWTLSPLLPRSNALFAVVRQVTSSAAASVHVGKQHDAAEQAVDASDAAASTYGLAVSLARGDGSAVPIVPNTHSIPFANPYFEGRALLILRTDSQQKYAHVFCDSRKNTQMVLQVQGKFKVRTLLQKQPNCDCSTAQSFNWLIVSCCIPCVQTVPQGRFYVGAEIPEQPKFSWLLKVWQHRMRFLGMGLVFIIESQSVACPWAVCVNRAFGRPWSLLQGRSSRRCTTRSATASSTS